MIANSHKRIEYPHPPVKVRPSLPARAASGGGVGDWRAWLSDRFPSYTTAPIPDGERHARFWDWVWAIQAGMRPPPYVAIWPRGGAKSSSAELACVAVAARQARRYGWYICETQDQADDHVANVATLLEGAGFARAVNKYGASRGWRRNRVRTPAFTLDALGLDVARRGAKLDEQRPDLMVIDDIDSETDTQLATEKKVLTLTRKLLPAGTPDLAVLAIQNLVHADSVFAQLADGRADFLSDRVVCGPEVALMHFDYTGVDGRWRITGEPTWEGQDLAACQSYVDTWGLAAFIAECQQDVGAVGRFFTMWSDETHLIDLTPPLPDSWIVWGALDWGWAHPTAAGLFAMDDAGDVFLVAEHVASHELTDWHAEHIIKLFAEWGVTMDDLRCFVAGMDVFSQRGDRHGKTIADQYADCGIVLSPAQTDRIAGASEVRARLGDPARNMPARFKVERRCVKTAACLPRMRHDPLRKEDVLKTNANAHGQGGDDEYDLVRYGLLAAPVRVTGKLAY